MRGCHLGGALALEVLQLAVSRVGIGQGQVIALDSRTLRWASPGFVARFGGLAEVVVLDYGDAVFWGVDSGVSVAVEYTSAVNLAESVMQSGRVLQQIRRAKAVHSHYFLVLWGDIRCDPDSGYFQRQRWNSSTRKMVWGDVIVPGSNKPVLYQAVDNWLNSLMVLCGVYVKRARDEAEMVKQTLDLYLYFQRPMESHTTTLADREYNPVFYPVEIPLVQQWASRIPGVGVMRSRGVSKVFPSARALANGSVEEWMKVGKIGRGIAERAHYEIGKEVKNGRQP